DLRQVLEAGGATLPRMLRDAAVVCAVVVVVRAVWMVVAWRTVRRSADPERAPRTGREAVVLAWCGMRGLATLALALALPATTGAGTEFPARAEIVLIATSVLVVTLVIPGFTLPVLVRMLGVAADADAECAVEQAIAARARAAALATLKADDRVDALPEEIGANLRQRLDRLDGLLRGEPASAEDREQMEKARRYRKISSVAQAEALAAARAEVLAARREPGVDPEAADRVLRRLDLRTVLLD
ncbi:MAG: monovalent cation/hydrogen antiporter, partial [Pseudonocardiales bacterium]|nr:monovalent cation/hydrogen antiporter [Pseudonocardiales bacterium]